MSPDNLPRGTSPPVAGGLAATDLADWRTVPEAMAEIGCSKRTIERLAAAKQLEARIRPQAGTPGVAVYHPKEVAEIAAQRRPAAAPFVLPAGTNGNGHRKSFRETSGSLTETLARSGDDPIRQLATAFQRFLLSPPSPPVAESVAETKYVTVRVAAAILGLPQADVRRLIHDGDLDHRLTGRGGIRIRRKDLEAL